MGWNLISGLRQTAGEERDRAVINSVWNKGIFIPCLTHNFGKQAT